MCKVSWTPWAGWRGQQLQLPRETCDRSTLGARCAASLSLNPRDSLLLSGQRPAPAWSSLNALDRERVLNLFLVSLLLMYHKTLKHRTHFEHAELYSHASRESPQAIQVCVLLCSCNALLSGQRSAPGHPYVLLAARES